MEKLFGLEMSAIAGALSAMVALVVAGLALLAWRRPVFLKLGLRPIPRRRAQSTLIVLGLMLATLIAATLAHGFQPYLTIRAEPFAFKTISTDENDQNQNGVPDDQEVDDRVDEHAIVDRHRTCCLRVD